jgi:hypothetical protein
MVGEVTINHGNDMRERNSARFPASCDMPECEGWAKAMPAVQIPDPAAVSVEIDVINRGHQFPRCRPAAAISRSAAYIQLILDRRRNELCQQVRSAISSLPGHSSIGLAQLPPSGIWAAYP